MSYLQVKITFLELNSYTLIEKISNFLWSSEILENLPVEITVPKGRILQKKAPHYEIFANKLRIDWLYSENDWSYGWVGRAV